MARLPVIVLTGFLGAGKTTLLNALLREPGLSKTAVLVNEFGEVGIDHALIVHASGEVVLLSNGCLCCSVREGLARTLLELARQRQAGEVPRFERVVIETSGLADPFPILEVLAADAEIAAAYEVSLVVTVTDATAGDAVLNGRAEAAAQVAAADVVWISKIEQAPADAHEPLRDALLALNPAAHALMGNDPAALATLAAACAGPKGDAGVQGDGTAGPQLTPDLRLQALAGLAQGPGRSGSQRSVERAGRATARSAGGVRHGWGCTCCPAKSLLPRAAPSHGVQSVCVQRDAPLEWPVLGAWLEGVMQACGDRLLRTKGIVWVPGGAGQPAQPWVLHGVGNRLAAPKPWAGEGRLDGTLQTSCIVFIGSDLDARWIGQALP